MDFLNRILLRKSNKSGGGSTPSTVSKPDHEANVQFAREFVVQLVESVPGKSEKAAVLTKQPEKEDLLSLKSVSASVSSFQSFSSVADNTSLPDLLQPECVYKKHTDTDTDTAEYESAADTASIEAASPIGSLIAEDLLASFQEALDKKYPPIVKAEPTTETNNSLSQSSDLSPLSEVYEDAGDVKTQNEEVKESALDISALCLYVNNLHLNSPSNSGQSDLSSQHQESLVLNSSCDTSKILPVLDLSSGDLVTNETEITTSETFESCTKNLKEIEINKNEVEFDIPVLLDVANTSISKETCPQILIECGSKIVQELETEERADTSEFQKIDETNIVAVSIPVECFELLTENIDKVENISDNSAVQKNFKYSATTDCTSENCVDLVTGKLEANLVNTRESKEIPETSDTDCTPEECIDPLNKNREKVDNSSGNTSEDQTKSQPSITHCVLEKNVSSLSEKREVENSLVQISENQEIPETSITDYIPRDCIDSKSREKVENSLHNAEDHIKSETSVTDYTPEDSAVLIEKLVLEESYSTDITLEETKAKQEQHLINTTVVLSEDETQQPVIELDNSCTDLNIVQKSESTSVEVVTETKSHISENKLTDNLINKIKLETEEVQSQVADFNATKSETEQGPCLESKDISVIDVLEKTTPESEQATYVGNEISSVINVAEKVVSNPEQVIHLESEVCSVINSIVTKLTQETSESENCVITNIQERTKEELLESEASVVTSIPEKKIPELDQRVQCTETEVHSTTNSKRIESEFKNKPHLQTEVSTSGAIPKKTKPELVKEASFDNKSCSAIDVAKHTVIPDNKSTHLTDNILTPIGNTFLHLGAGDWSLTDNKGAPTVLSELFEICNRQQKDLELGDEQFVDGTEFFNSPSRTTGLNETVVIDKSNEHNFFEEPVLGNYAEFDDSITEEAEKILQEIINSSGEVDESNIEVEAIKQFSEFEQEINLKKTYNMAEVPNNKTVVADENDVNPFISQSGLCRSPPPSSRTSNQGASPCESPRAKSKLSSVSPHKDGSLSHEHASGDASPRNRSGKNSPDRRGASHKISNLDGSPKNSINPEVNQSEAGPEIADDGNLQSGDVFKDPAAFEYLNSVGNSHAMTDLRKESLYVKFDPLVGTTSRTVDKAVPLPLLDSNRCASSTPIKNPAISVIDKLISLSPSPAKPPPEIQRAPSPVKEVPVRQEPKVNESMVEELYLLREVLAKQDEKHRDDIFALEKELSELRHQVASSQTLVKESEERESKMNKKMVEKAQGQKQMTIIMHEYEKTISRLVAEKEQERQAYDLEKSNLVKDRDAAMGHLANIEIAFSDLHKKYERSKSVIEGMKKNEEILRTSLAEYEATIRKQEQKYDMLKSHAMSQLENANQELDALRRSQQAEAAKLKAMLKKAEIKTSSLEETLEQKVKENQELASICDELINKVGSSE